MARVTIEGSITPSTFLRRGARITVERTDYIDKLIRRGYVTVVQDFPAAAAAAAEEVAQTVQAQHAAVDAERQLSGTPARNASRDEWAAFMGDRAQFDDSHTRNDLIQMWDEIQSPPRAEHQPEDVEAEDDGDATD